MTPEQRIHELKTRQVFYGSSLVCKLNSVNGYWWYSVYAWLEQGKEDSKILVLMNKYNGEDPEDLFKLALKELDLRKIKIGVPLVNVSQRAST